MRKFKYQNILPLNAVVTMLLLVFANTCLAQNAPFTQLTNLDVQHQMHSDQFTLITVGDNQMPILIAQSEQAITKGVVFIIGDADMALGRKDSLTQVSRSLPSLGWTTVILPSLGLSLGPNIAFPLEDDPAKTEQQEIKDNQGDAAPTMNDDEQQTPVEQDNEKVDVRAAAEVIDEDTVEDAAEPTEIQDTQTASINSYSFQGGISEVDLVLYTQELAAYLSSALKHMQPTMGHRILISQGITAATVTKLVADGNAATLGIDTLIISNPYWPVRKLNNKIPMIVAQTPIPLLDLVSPWDNSWSKQTQELRVVKSRTELKEVYRQSEIIGQPFNQTQMTFITRQIKGWTVYLGW